MRPALFSAPGPKLSLRIVEIEKAIPVGSSKVLVYRTESGETGFDADSLGLVLLREIAGTSHILDWKKRAFKELSGGAEDVFRAIRLQLRPIALVVQQPDESAINEMNRLSLRRQKEAANSLRKRYGGSAAPQETAPLETLELGQTVAAAAVQFLVEHSENIQFWGMSDRGLHAEIQSRNGLDLRQLAAAHGVEYIDVDHQDKLPSW